MGAAADIWKASAQKLAMKSSENHEQHESKEVLEDVGYAVEITREVIEPFLNDRDFASVDAFDLYDAMLMDLQSKFESSNAISAIYKERSDTLLNRLAKSEAELNAAKQAKAAIIKEFANAPIGVTVDTSQVDALKRDCEEKTAIIAQLEADKVALVAEAKVAKDKFNAELKVFIGRFEGSEKAILSLSREAERTEQLGRNLLAAAEGRLSDVRKAALAEKTKLSSALAKSQRELEVANKDLAKFKATVSKQKAESISVLETLQNAKRIRDELTDALAEARNDRRYLTMLVDSLTYQQVLTYPEGSVSLFSFQTHNISSEDDEFVIDESFPIALWQASNGFSCVLAVSPEREGGDRELVMPDSPLLSRKAISVLCPPKKYQNEIVEKLMEFDVVACNEALTKSRLIISQLAVKSEFEENAKLTNRELMAYSKARRQSVAAHFSSKSQRKIKKSKRG